MRSIRSVNCFDGIETHLIVDNLHLLGLLDSDGAGVHSEEDTVLDDDIV